ncbi:MAG: phosphate signaling complex protein PhoU [Candidatus Aminicenantes bacterium]|nr:phosphate signaling complex protein PhoU [Candidatus Aminicenantes bacterium]
MLAKEVTMLKQRLIEYASHVDRMIDKCISGLLNKEPDKLKQIMEEDESKANDLEIEIEELCTTLIAKFQPAAKDLRTIMMIAQMNNDLERMADLAVNIAESAVFLVERPSVKPLIDIPYMAQITTQMVKDAIDSFIKEDPDLALSVCTRDSIIDDLKDQISRELLTHMVSNPATIDRSFQLIRIANSLERIADLSTNICEDVIYIIKGKIIKHHKDA